MTARKKPYDYVQAVREAYFDGALDRDVRCRAILRKIVRAAVIEADKRWPDPQTRESVTQDLADRVAKELVP